MIRSYWVQLQDGCLMEADGKVLDFLEGVEGYSVAVTDENLEPEGDANPRFRHPPEDFGSQEFFRRGVDGSKP